ncbi:MAG: YafY family transcriptional regulator [Actinobacteria bacterium]|nr:MAG: YafY family transcriptional regulator [Actinomycetota bacterium]
MSRDRTRGRLLRLLSLVPYLLANPGVSPEEAARAFSVDRATLERDLDLLWFCGVPPYDPFALIDVERDDEHITLSSAGYFSRPLRLTRQEAVSIAAALEALGEQMQEVEALGTLLEKVRAAVGEPVEEKQVLFAPAPADPSVFETLSACARRQVSVRITYYSASSGRLADRTIDPYRLISVGGNWYALAYCHLAGDDRLFRLDRISAAKATESPFDLRDKIETTDYERGILYTESNADKKAEVRFSPQAARWARETWPACEGEEHADGSLTLSIPYTGEAWMVRQLLGYGPAARVLAPPELVNALLQTTAELIDNYS